MICDTCISNRVDMSHGMYCKKGIEGFPLYCKKGIEGFPDIAFCAGYASPETNSDKCRDVIKKCERAIEMHHDIIRITTEILTRLEK